MEIKSGKYILKSDKFSMFIEEEYISEEEKTKGKLMTRRVAGFCTSFESLLTDFVDKKLKDSDARSMEEALKVLDEASKEVKQIGKDAAKGKFRIVRHKESEDK